MNVIKVKNKLVYFFIIFSFLIEILPKNIAFADALTLYEIGAAAYAVAPGFGINTVFSGGNNQYSEVAIGDMINTYVGDDTIAQKFGEDQLRLLAGDLIIPATLYNHLSEFWDWAKLYYDLDGNLQAVNEMVNDVTLNRMMSGNVTINGYTTINEARSGYWYTGWQDPTGQTYTANNVRTSTYTYSGFEIIRNTSTQFINKAHFNDKTTGLPTTQQRSISISGVQYKKLSLSTGDSVLPAVIDPSYEWLGHVGDYEDTNLPELLGHIYEDVEGNNLIVEGDIQPIDPPQPTPTPAPIDPDTPLSDVPWEGLDTNLQDLYNQGLEEIGAIGDAQDAITDAVADQTGALEDALADNAGVVSGAIDQAVSDVQTAIGTQTGSITGAIGQAAYDVQSAIGAQTAALDESLSTTAEGVETIAEALEDEPINWQKYDLRGLFPFCIPFDIYNMLQALDASPTAPHVQLPFEIASIGFSYLIDLDFSAFDQVAAVMRQMELIVYAIALAWATSKVIKW